jgi:Sad1 / UNC-like C-terminal.
LKEENDTGDNLQDVEETDGIKDDNSISLSDTPINVVNDDEPSGNETESVQTPEKIKQSENAEDCASNEKEEEEEEKNKPVEVDYANKSTGAQIVDKSKKFQGTSNLLVNDKDKYAMIECDAGEGAKYVIIGLSEEIRVKSIKLLSYERYSSLTKKFQVLGSQTYPVMTEWEDLGTFDAKPWYKENKEQTFEPAQPGWARYLKFRFLEHYGNEHYCSYTQIKVHGSTTLQGFHEMQLEQNEAAEAAKAVVDEIEHVSYVKSEKRDTDNNVAADGKDHVEEEEVEEEELRSSNTDNIVEPNESHEKDDGGVTVTSHPDRVSSHKDEEQSPNATGTTSVVDEKKSESVEVDKPETRASPKQDLNSDAHENQNVEVMIEDSANDSQKKVSEEQDITGHQQEASNGDILESNEPKKIDVGKADKVINTEDDVARSNHSKELENVTLKASDMAKNAPNAHDSEEEVKGNPEPSSPPSVSNAVTSAINSVKNGSLMKDAVQGINKIIHSSAESKPNPEGSVHHGAASPVEISSDDKSNEINTENVHSSESIVSAKEIHNPEHVAIHPSDLLDDSVQSELPGQGIATKSNSNDITNKANVSSTREDLLIAQEMVQMLSDRFPNAKCLDYLDFAEFKRRTLDVVNQKGSSIGEKPRVTVQKNEPIFKKLTDEIKGLQASQSVYEQYIKAATSCYQRVILDLGNEVVVKQNEQDHRMKSLEDEMKKLKEEKLHHRLSAEDIRAIIYSLFESLASLTVKISPSLYSWCESLISFIAVIIERILTDDRVKRMISIAVAYKRDGCIFALGILCSYVFLNVSMKLNNPRKKNRKGQYKREKVAQHRSKNKEGIIAALHNAPSLHTDEEDSY